MQPKWGFLPQANTITPAEAAKIKSQHSRYVLHRHYKREGLDDTYDPLDLFATDLARVEKSLEALWSIWKDTAGAKNNWRVYMNGKPIMPNQVKYVPVVWRHAYIRLICYPDPGTTRSSLVRRHSCFLPCRLQRCYQNFEICSIRLTPLISQLWLCDSGLSTRTKTFSTRRLPRSQPSRNSMRSWTNSSPTPRTITLGLCESR